MTKENLPPFLTALLDPAVYSHEVDEVQLVQTHISFVLLAGAFVYKIKKPVDFGFLDFTTLEKRQHFCEEELQLNRRLCPTLYLETLPINFDGEQYTINGPGDTVEYCLKMDRMPEEKMMGNVIKAGALDKSMLNTIVDILVPFYEKAESDSGIGQFGQAESVAVNVLENFEQTEGFIGDGALTQEQFSKISLYAKGFLENEELFATRVSEGRVCDCHGDLYSANICLAHEVFIFDCIEFNQRFRYCDVASDVAFLAMDLDYQGLGDLSRYFIDTFIEKSGDSGIKKVLGFYKCYRAYVRGKIGLFTAHSPEVDAATKESSIGQAKKYFLLAEQYASQG